jgi:rare lipoprotein A
MANALLSIGLASSCTLSHAKSAHLNSSAKGEQFGVASYYSDRFHGRRTASGERYDRNALTADHPNLPFGTLLRVTNLDNHLSVVVKVNDRTRLPRGRVLDLSRRAANELRFIRSGLARVRLEIINPADS